MNIQRKKLLAYTYVNGSQIFFVGSQQIENCPCMASFVGIVAIFVYMLLHFSQGESRQGLRLIICGGNEL